MPGEQALYATFQSLLDAAAKDPKLKQMLTQTAVADGEGSRCAALRLPQQWKARGQRMDLALQRSELGLRLSLAAGDGEVEHVRQRAERDALYLHRLRFDESTSEWRPRLHGDLCGRADSPCRWLLVAHSLQQRASVRAEPLEPLLARHQEQVDEAECRRLAHHLRAEHFARRRTRRRTGFPLRKTISPSTSALTGRSPRSPKASGFRRTSNERNKLRRRFSRRYFILSTSLGTQALSKNSCLGPYSPRITKNPFFGTVRIQFLLPFAGASGPK